jgi:PTS system fructose-specific IIA component/PTS system nitrogen regulatory IIA component
MRLADLLSELVISGELSATTREEAIEELVRLLADAGHVARDRARELSQAVLRRERLGSTAIGKGVAIPHSKTHLGSSCVAALGRSSRGIDWHALDGRPVHLALLLVGSAEAPNAHLRMLAHASRALTQTPVHDMLIAAKDRREILDVLAGLEPESAGSRSCTHDWSRDRHQSGGGTVH